MYENYRRRRSDENDEAGMIKHMPVSFIGCAVEILVGRKQKA